MVTFWKKDLVWNKTKGKIPGEKKKKPPNPEDKAWREFSAFIRLRDCLRTMGMPEVGRCISCKAIIPYKGNDAGHFISRSNRAIKYHLKNVHLQCRRCNSFLSGNVTEYRKNLVALYWSEFVEYLENVRDISKIPSDWEGETKKWRAAKKLIIKAYKEGKIGRTQAEIKNRFANSGKLDILDEFLKGATDFTP